MKIRIRKEFLVTVAVAVSLISFACQNTPQTTTQSNSNANSNVNASPAVSASPDSNTNSSAANTSSTQTETHEHKAPHGGTLISFGEEFAHLELVLNAESGELTAYALDGEAEKSVPLAQKEIEIEIEKPKKTTLRLAARENALTGEKTGATSEFRVSSDELKKTKEFDAKITAITIRGREFKNIHFNFPKGNEEEHDH